MKNTRSIALIITLLAAVAIVLLLTTSTLSFDADSIRPSRQPAAEIAAIDEEFVDFLDTRKANSTPSKAYTPEPQNNKSAAADASGTYIKDAGPQGQASPDVTSSRPSPVVRQKKEKTAPSGPTKEELEEQARRKLRKGISDAFKPNEDAQDNADNKGKKPGDSGDESGSQNTVNGNGQGSVDGGWIMPHFAKVSSTLTGSIILVATVGQDGRVIRVDMKGGKAPASGNTALIERCKTEVRRHTFTRSGNTPAPATAKATITYTFR